MDHQGPAPKRARTEADSSLPMANGSHAANLVPTLNSAYTDKQLIEKLRAAFDEDKYFR